MVRCLRKKKSFLGLQGKAWPLAQLFLVVCPAFVLLGYNQSNLDGLVDLEDSAKSFLRIDTETTTGTQHDNNSTVKGAVIAVFALGTLTGCLPCAYKADTVWSASGHLYLSPSYTDRRGPQSECPSPGPAGRSSDELYWALVSGCAVAWFQRGKASALPLPTVAGTLSSTGFLSA